MGAVSHILSFVVAVLVLITVHEFGHFWVAKRLKIKVVRFSIGFGKPIWRRVAKDGTEYVIGMLPLGGYVRLLDESDSDVAGYEKQFAYNRRPVWQRLMVVLAGPLTNFLFAIIAFWLIFTLGVKQMKPIIGHIKPHSIAAQAGMVKGQEFVNIDGASISNWQDVALQIAERMGETGTMTITTVSPHNQAHHYQLNLAKWTMNDLRPKPIESLGIVPYRPPVTSKVVKLLPDGAAVKAGIQVGDHIDALDGKPVKDWYEFVEFIQLHPGKQVKITVSRDGKQLTLPVTIGKRYVGLRKVGVLGVESDVGKIPAHMLEELNYNLLTAWVPATREVYQLTSFNVVMLGKMLLGQVSIRSLGGPITIFRIADRAFKDGFIVYVGFLAIISIMLGFVNLLPIPGLDGGHILYYIIEIIMRRPLSVAVQTLTFRIGIILLVVLIVQATVNDLLRLV